MSTRMMGDNVGVTSRKRFNAKYVEAGSRGGVVRLIIVIVGLVAIILGSIGSPDDSKSRNTGLNPNSRINQFDEFYGYGRGYINQPLNIVFISFVIIAWIFAFVFILLLGCEISHSLAVRLNRILYPVFGVLILIGVGCGCLGTFYFWQSCCHVSFTSQSANNAGKYLTYQYYQYYTPVDSSEGLSIDPKEWCRCSYLVDGGNSNPQYVPELGNKNLISAWPHHLIPHCCSLVVAVLLAILYFIAACIV